MNKFVKGAIVAGAAIAIPAAVNAAIFSSAKALGNSIGGEGRFWPWREGDLFYTKKGDREPVIVLLHGLYPGASAFEWRNNFDDLSKHFTVYALDWLGFGLSDKPKIHYTSDIVIEALLDFLREVVGKPAIVLASGQSAPIASEAARIGGETAISSLVFVNPISSSAIAGEADPGIQVTPSAFHHTPLVSTSVYNAMTTRSLIRKQLEEAFYNHSLVTDELVEHYFSASHQYGSQYSALCLLAGELDSDIAASLPQLKQQIHFIWGREASKSPLSRAKEIVSDSTNAELTVIDNTSDMPHIEKADEFDRLIVQWLSK
jgi:pimeloyl-ACP methyl ester carboxylesterase